VSISSTFPAIFVHYNTWVQIEPNMESISSTFFVCLFLYKSLFPSYVLALNELFFYKKCVLHGIFENTWYFQKIWPGNGKNHPFLHFIWFNWVDLIALIRSRQSDWVISQWLKTPFLVRFGLNLGLNSLKFGQKAISDRIDSIWSSQSNWVDPIRNGILAKF
jgi:hypothetical protein